MITSELHYGRWNKCCIITGTIQSSLCCTQNDQCEKTVGHPPPLVELSMHNVLLLLLLKTIANDPSELCEAKGGLAATGAAACTAVPPHHTTIGMVFAVRTQPELSLKNAPNYGKHTISSRVPSCGPWIHTTRRVSRPYWRPSSASATTMCEHRHDVGDGERSE